MADIDRIKANLGKMIGQGAPEADIDAYLKTEGFNSPEEWRVAAQPTGGTRVARDIGQGAIGFNDAVANTVGAPVDAAAWLMRKVGVPVGDTPIGGSESLKKGIDYVATLPGRVGDAVSQGSFTPLTDDRTSRFEPETREEKIARGVGEGVGNALAVVAPAGLVGRAGTAASRVADTVASAPGSVTRNVVNSLAVSPGAQTALGAVQGGATGLTDSPAAGLAAGIAVPGVMGAARFMRAPVRNALSPQEANLVAAAQREGIDLTPAQITGSPNLRGLEETAARLPLANGPMQGAYQTQRRQFNRAVLQRAGVDADSASPEVMDQAFRTAGQTFDDLASRTTLNIDPQFGGDVRQVVHDYGRRLPTDVAPVFRSYVDDLEPLMQAAAPGQAGSNLPATTSTLNPQVAGDTYLRIRSDLTRRIRSSQNNPYLQEALGGLVDALDGAMERSSTPQLQQAWQEARQRYAALMTIDKAMQGGTQASRSAADIPFGAFSNAVKAGDKAGFASGRGQFNELSRIGDFLGPRIPNSGTPERQFWTNLLTAGTSMGAGIPLLGLPGAAFATATPYLASRFYNSAAGRNYLTRQLTDAPLLDYPALARGVVARQGLSEATGGGNALSRKGASR
ncbi:MAG: hypothetical protein JSR91_00185 [Proteobacteria bacterium]|nr:hypothetical protein [Pseudomonadota bacterium]